MCPLSSLKRHYLLLLTSYSFVASRQLTWLDRETSRRKFRQLKQVCFSNTTLISASECSRAYLKNSGISEVYPLDGADTSSTPAFCLKLPGRRLNLTALLYAKRFRDHGYKTGALAAFNQLEEAGLGMVETVKAKSVLVSLD